MEEKVCAYCGDPIEGEPVRRGSKLYCCEACAFEANRSKDCGGRTDSVTSQPLIEFPDGYGR